MPPPRRPRRERGPWRGALLRASRAQRRLFGGICSASVSAATPTRTPPARASPSAGIGFASTWPPAPHLAWGSEAARAGAPRRDGRGGGCHGCCFSGARRGGGRRRRRVHGFVGHHPKSSSAAGELRRVVVGAIAGAASLAACGCCPDCSPPEVNDIYLNYYLAVNPTKHAIYLPHTAGRYSAKRFRKAQCPILERLTNSLMMHGHKNGKKIMAVRIVKHAMEIIHLLTNANPIQIIIDAIVNRKVWIQEEKYCQDRLYSSNCHLSFIFILRGSTSFTKYCHMFMQPVFHFHSPPVQTKAHDSLTRTTSPLSTGPEPVAVHGARARWGMGRRRKSSKAHPTVGSTDTAHQGQVRHLATLPLPTHMSSSLHGTSQGEVRSPTTAPFVYRRSSMDNNRQYNLLKAALGSDLARIKDIIRSPGIRNGDRVAIFSFHKDGVVLHCAACMGHLEVCKYLVEELGGDPNMAGGVGPLEGMTPFMASAQSGDISIVKYLLDHGGDPTKAYANGHTVLHHAVCSGSCTVTVFLLQKGIHVDIDCGHGTPLCQASIYEQDKTENFVGSPCKSQHHFLSHRQSTEWCSYLPFIEVHETTH